MKIELQNISARYGKKTVLRNLDFVFNPGKIYGIIGANGTGKSTLIKILARILTPSTGKITWNGKALAEISSKNLAKKLALLPQHPPIPEELSVEELVYLGRLPHQSWCRRYTERDKSAVMQALAECNLNGLKQRLVNTLSGGEQQRAWLALTLAQQPETLLLDEPATGLDIKAQQEFFAYLRAGQAQRNLTVIMVIHDLNSALRNCDELLLLHNESIAVHGAAAAVLTPENVTKYFQITPCCGTAADGLPYILT